MRQFDSFYFALKSFKFESHKFEPRKMTNIFILKFAFASNFWTNLVQRIVIS